MSSSVLAIKYREFERLVLSSFSIETLYKVDVRTCLNNANRNQKVVLQTCSTIKSYTVNCRALGGPYLNRKAVLEEVALSEARFEYHFH